MRSRIYCMESGGKLYMIFGGAAVGDWVDMKDVFDSSASTFEVGDFVEEPVRMASPARPVAPATPPVSPQVPRSVTPPPPPPEVERPKTWMPRGSPLVEVQQDGEWVPAMIVEESDAQVCIRYSVGRERGTTIWLNRDQVRPRAPGPPREHPTADPSRTESPRTELPRTATSPPPPVPVPSAVVPESSLPSRRAERSARPERFSHTETMSLDSALAMLGDRSSITQKNGAEALAAMEPEHTQRAAVVKQLMAVWKQNSIISQPAAGKALGVWADPATEKWFTDRLLSCPRTERRAIFEFLAVRKTPTAAKALARRLRISEDASEAGRFLVKIGSVAEVGVRDIVTDTNKQVKKSAIDILKEIGTLESIPMLKRAAADQDASVAASARLAIDAIERRGK
ncbi:MAG: hypothetical protein FWD53_11065 [Phycisphaerales bacterium]|nr:hypothetical protein [Phycisphaerales bacterium]